MSIEQDNCCINIIDVDRGDDGQIARCLLRTVNLTAYNLNKSRHGADQHGAGGQTGERAAQRRGLGKKWAHKTPKPTVHR